MHTCIKSLDSRNVFYMALDSKGQWILRKDPKCYSCVNVIQIFPPVLSLVFHRKEETLELIIYSGEFLWRRDDDDSGVTCYTDADSALLSNVKIKDLVWSDKIKATDIIGLNNNFNREYISKSIYELKLGKDTPGRYWCEGLSLPNYEVVKSAPVIAYEEDDGTAFAFRTITECNKCKGGFTKKKLKELAKDFRKLLKKYDYKERIDEVKIMRIEELPQNSSKLEMIFHVFVEEEDVSRDKCPKNISREICTLHQLYNDMERIANRSSGRDHFYNITVRHTEFCLPYKVAESDEIQWMSATIGERSVLQQLCLTTNLLPVYRFCKGDFVIGAKWDQHNIPVCKEDDIPETTQKLFDLDNSEKAPVELIDRMKVICTSVDSSEFIPADLYLMSSLTRTIAKSNDSDIGFDEIEKMVTIFSHTMEVNETIAKASQLLNSTNTLLDMNERIVSGVLINASISNKTISGQEVNRLMGVIKVEAKNIITYVIDPSVANISGIALYRSDGNSSDDLSDFTVEYLYKNQSTLDLIENREDLEVATFIPEDLLRRINEINQTIAINATQQPKPPLRIVINVIANDRFFQVNHNVSFFRVNGRIVTVKIPGYGPNLPTFLPIIFHANQKIVNESQACGFWDFTPEDRKIFSEWATTGCEFLSQSSSIDPPIVLCGCSHITNFAFLVTGVFKHDLPPEEMIIQEIHMIALDIITVLGCSLSLAGVVGIWITAIFFKTWREKAGSKVLLQLSVAIAIQMLLFLFINAEYLVKGVNKTEMRIICITLGALLQYSVLVVFSWMLITAYLQYLRYVVVFGNPRPPHFTLKSIIVGWILPILPVILVLGLDIDSYLPPNFFDEGNLQGTSCYPQGNSLYFGVLLPVGLIFIANFAIFIAVIYSITRKMDQSSKKNDKEIQMAQIRLSVLLFFLLGMSWIFGFLVYTQKGGNLIFNYLFCVTATLQGFVLFAYFVIMDPATRKLWEQFFISLACRKSNKCT
ncbi:adhesion G-protein coupled receptor G2-like [Phlebotomus argentipes]|uniref:adhesion G-protein coupled receptor G2-like n=1 Tax=Phlebotomus argentipes TaxID=94469 RepID=UPI00289335E7|nr:adhesion G-protein coupled receptor G2-like [Phlebotomus argentipes]